MVRLAVIPGNSIDDLVQKGLAGRLGAYYNPRSFFEEVLCLSPFESEMRHTFGLRIIPTRDVELPSRLRAFKVGLVRAYGTGTPAEMAVFHRAWEIPVIISVHDRRAGMIRAAARFADAVFVVSDELRMIMEARGVAPSRIFVVPNGVDAEVMKPLLPDAIGDLLSMFPFRYKLLHVGRRSPEKNIETLVRTLARLGPDYGLVAVGQGDAAPYISLAQELGVSDRCIFHDAVEQKELVHFYNWADCVCHPSRSEAMCNVLIEALACGAAVVASAVAAHGLGVVPGQVMQLVDDPEDNIAFTAEIRRICAGVSAPGVQASRRAAVEHLFLENAQAHEIDCYRRVMAMAACGAFRRNIFQRIHVRLAGLWCRLARSLGIFR